MALGQGHPWHPLLVRSWSPTQRRALHVVAASVRCVCAAFASSLHDGADRGVYGQGTRQVPHLGPASPVSSGRPSLCSQRLPPAGEAQSPCHTCKSCYQTTRLHQQARLGPDWTAQAFPVPQAAIRPDAECTTEHFCFLASSSRETGCRPPPRTPGPPSGPHLNFRPAEF